jgi:hypothetical protein
VRIGNAAGLLAPLVAVRPQYERKTTMTRFMRSLPPLFSLLAAAGTASAQETFTFCESGGGSSGAAASMVVTEEDGGVSLVITNEGGEDASIVGVYFDDRQSVLTDGVIVNGDGVVFEEGGSPADLPGGNKLAPPFETSIFFTADPNAPDGGISADEQLELQFDLGEGFTFDDLLEQLASGELRIGLNANAGPGSGTLIVQRCRADFNCDSAVDLFDFLAFTNAFNKGETSADFTGEGTLDLFDFLMFVNEFNACAAA